MPLGLGSLWAVDLWLSPSESWAAPWPPRSLLLVGFYSARFRLQAGTTRRLCVGRCVRHGRSRMAWKSSDYFSTSSVPSRQGIWAGIGSVGAEWVGQFHVHDARLDTRVVLWGWLAAWSLAAQAPRPNRGDQLI